MTRTRTSLVALAAATLMTLGGATAAVAAGTPAESATTLPATVQTQAPSADGAETFANADFARGTSICRNEGLVSGNGSNVLLVRENGDVAVLHNGRQVWSLGTQGRGECLNFQQDGNLVVYTAGGVPIWQAPGAWQRGQSLSVQDDGNVVLYDARGNAIWHTNTARSGPRA